MSTSSRLFKALAVLGIVALSFWLLSSFWQLLLHFTDILLLLFLAWLLAFVLSPIAAALERRGVPRALGALGVYLILAVATVIAGLLVLPLAAQQFSELVRQLEALAPKLQASIPTLQQELQDRGIPAIDLTAIYSSVAGQLQGAATTMVLNTLGVVAGVASFFTSTILVLILSFYIMLDGPQLKRRALAHLPAGIQPEARLLVQSMERNFGAFIRGQLLIALIYGSATLAVMRLWGLEYGLVGGITAGLLMLIPIVGSALALAPPAIVALAAGGASLLPVMIALLAVQILVVYVLSPRIMGDAVGIHPLVVLVASMVGAKEAGLWGALFGIPVAGVLMVMLRHAYRVLVHERFPTWYQPVSEVEPMGRPAPEAKDPAGLAARE